MKVNPNHLAESSNLQDSVGDLIYRLSQIDADEVIAELSKCDPAVLRWLLNDVVLPSGLYDIASILVDLLHQDNIDL